MSNVELVLRAEDLVVDVLRRHGTSTADSIESAVAGVEPALGRKVVGVAVLRLLRDDKIRLTEDYELALPAGEAARGGAAVGV